MENNDGYFCITRGFAHINYKRLTDKLYSAKIPIKNYILVAMGLKFGNSNISMRDVTITSDLASILRGGLNSSSIILGWH